jgi:soluble lytic murein transglycosylase
MRVTEWLTRQGEVDLDLFVEEIPFDQTRNYIRRVTSHLAHYMYLRDPNAGWPALDLPERVGPIR